MKSAALLFLISILALSCASVGRLDLDVAPPTQSEFIFVIGIDSPNLKINVFPGKMVGGKFQKSIIRPAAISATPTQGYIVGRSKGDDLLAITEIAFVKDCHTIIGDQYMPMDDTKTIVFKASPGRVIYLGNINFGPEGSNPKFTYTSNFDGAKNYIDKNYTNLKGRLEFEKPDFLATTNSSTPRGPGGPLYVPIPPHR